MTRHADDSGLIRRALYAAHPLFCETSFRTTSLCPDLKTSVMLLVVTLTTLVDVTIPFQ